LRRLPRAVENGLFRPVAPNIKRERALRCREVRQGHRDGGGPAGFAPDDGAHAERGGPGRRRDRGRPGRGGHGARGERGSALGECDAVRRRAGRGVPRRGDVVAAGPMRGDGGREARRRR